jgi:tRNA G18 (ribose-2'-O)-methylase SpoU
MTNIHKLAVSDITESLSEHNVYDEYKPLTIQERKIICDREQLPYEVAILNVTGELNVSNIIRSASLCGARKVHVLGRRRFDKRGTVGAENYIDVVRENYVSENDPLKLDVPGILTYFNRHKLFPVFVEQYDGMKLDCSRELIQDVMNWNRTPTFVFGNENRGIPAELIKSFSGVPVVYQIKQRGVIRSFNVGSAAAIVLYEATKLFT